METTRFLTAIEEENTLLEQQNVGKSAVVEDATTEKQSGSDLINFGGEPEPTKPPKTRHVDRFFSKQAEACLLSPIKPDSAVGSMIIDATQESLELKLDTSEHTSRPQEQAQCIQPNNLTFTIEGDTFEQLIKEPDEDRPQNGCPVPESPSRKRPQDEMEPAVFDVPRETKLLHREEQLVPEFRENAKPVLQFSTGANEVFKANVGDATDLDSRSKEMSSDVKIGEELKTTDEPKSGEVDEGTDSPGEAVGGHHRVNRVESPNGRFNMTLDMTLRTTGGAAIASGLFLAIDEALDPLVGALLPHGRRRRGANIVVACIPIVLAIYLFFFR